MDALLGKITDITEGAAGDSLEIRFKEAGVLPRRTRAPEWLKDQVLTVRRHAPDPREVGNPGDSVVLTPAESARWLCPLAVSPGVAYGELPPTLHLRSRALVEGRYAAGVPASGPTGNGDPARGVREGKAGGRRSPRPRFSLPDRACRSPSRSRVTG